jgi:site-specific recombinase XerD
MTSIITMQDNLQKFYLGPFQRHLRAENASSRTIETYSEAVRRLVEFLADKNMPMDPAGLTREHIQEFIRDQLVKHKPTTAANRYRSLQQYFRWLVEEGEIRESPMARMRPPRVPESPIPVLSETDIAKLLKACSGTDFEARRDTAIISLLLDTGVRRSELAGLTLGDLDLDAQTITVVGKGGRLRTVAYGRKAARDLDRYLRLRENHPFRDSPRLWLGRGGPMTDNGIYQALRKRGRRAGIKSKIFLHIFRHTFAHLWLEGGGQEGDLMRLTGWASRSMVDRYAKSTAGQRARQAHKVFSPRDRF